jgi:hypothetical protein
VIEDDDGKLEELELEEDMRALEVVAVVAIGATVGLVVLAVGIVWGAVDLAGQALEAWRRK